MYNIYIYISIVSVHAGVQCNYCSGEETTTLHRYCGVSNVIEPLNVWLIASWAMQHYIWPFTFIITSAREISVWFVCLFGSRFRKRHPDFHKTWEEEALAKENKLKCWSWSELQGGHTNYFSFNVTGLGGRSVICFLKPF